MEMGFNDIGFESDWCGGHTIQMDACNNLEQKWLHDEWMKNPHNKRNIINVVETLNAPLHF